jgi:hypothetical protein
MTWRFVVVDHGVRTSAGKTGIYKILVNQTARLMNESGHENIELFDNLEDAKEAAFLIVERCQEEANQDYSRFSNRPDPSIQMLKAEMSNMTEDRVEAFFI